MLEPELAILWVARGMVLLYLVRLTQDLAGWPCDPQRRTLRNRLLLWLWSAACGLNLLHVLLAFHYEHHWSHTEAWQHTAERTRALTGWYWGGGLWLNYLFTLCWWGDLGISLRYGLDQLSVRYKWLLHAVMLFMLINATLVFGVAAWWVMLLPLIALMLVGIRALRTLDQRAAQSAAAVSSAPAETTSSAP